MGKKLMILVFFAFCLVGCPPDKTKIPDWWFDQDTSDTDEGFDPPVHHNSNSYGECVPGVDESVCDGSPTQSLVTSDETGKYYCADVTYCGDCSTFVCVSWYNDCGGTYCADLYDNLSMCESIVELPQGNATPLELTQAAPGCAGWLPAEETGN